MVDYILYFFAGIWAYVWAWTFGLLLFSHRHYRQWVLGGRKFKYGVIDVLGILALIGIIARNW